MTGASGAHGGREPALTGAKNRLLQLLALYAPGATTVRPQLHRWRGVSIGDDVFISTDAILETSYPKLISIGNEVVIGIRCVIIGHFRLDEEEPLRQPSVRIEDQVFIGPGVYVLPNVTIGHGAVVNAGSIVTRSVPPLTMVQGNPAVPVARCGVPLGAHTPLKEFYRALRPIKAAARGDG
jgi:acetyltransferase-like isoleucine patch superfamily enzyme